MSEEEKLMKFNSIKNGMIRKDKVKNFNVNIL